MPPSGEEPTLFPNESESAMRPPQPFPVWAAIATSSGVSIISSPPFHMCHPLKRTWRIKHSLSKGFLVAMFSKTVRKGGSHILDEILVYRDEIIIFRIRGRDG